MSDPRGLNEVWQAARDAADAIVELPPLRTGGAPVELFLRLVEGSGSAGFRMGSRGQFDDEEPIHRVVIEDDFYLGTFVVTQDQWAAVWPGIDAAGWYRKGSPLGDAPGQRPSDFGDRPDSGLLPVEQVSWYDALAYCEWLTGHMKVIGGRNQPAGVGWRFCLPTESEWEYACRGGLEGAGRDTEYWNGDGEAALREVGWFDGNSGYRTHAVTEPVVAGQPEAHPLGLFGMHGNVREWCHEEGDSGAYRRRLDGAADPAVAHRAAVLGALRQGGPAEVAALVPRDRLRVVRGGSWFSPAGWCRSAIRFSFGPDVRFDNLGFRVCLVRGPAAGKQAFGGGAAAAENRAEADQAEPGKADGTRPQPGGAGEAEAPRLGRRGAGVAPPAAQPRARGFRGWLGALWRGLLAGWLR
jgi:formylglycine-generating enzyme required for sulfatase activity